MLILADRVKESSLSTGVGAVTLNGPVAGYQAFSSVLSSGDQTYYTIVNNQAWEVGVGTYSPSSISRDTILSSSTGSKINLSGQSFVFIAYPAEKSVYRDINDQIVVTDSGIRFNDGTVQTTAGGGGSYTAGNGLQLSGSQFSVDNTVVQSGDNISVLVNNAGYLTSHPSIAAASSSNNSGRIYIQDILLDSNGHVTGITTATETVVDTDTTYSAGTGLQLSGTTFSVDSSVVRSGNNISLLNNNSNYTTSGSNIGQFVNDVGYLTSHPTISAASSSNNSGRTYIQDILLDGNGHITGIVTATETVTDTDTTYTAGSGLQLSGTQFSVSNIVIKSGDNISLLNNNSNYIGSGSNITQLINDAGYLTSHPVISAASSSNNSGRTYIQDILLDSNGHITGIVTATETVTDTDTTYSAGTGLQLSGTTFSVDSTVARSGNNVTIFANNAGYLTSHPTINAASNVANSAHYFIQSLLFDSNGHVTGVTSALETTHDAGDGIVIEDYLIYVDETIPRFGSNLLLFNNESSKFTSSGSAISQFVNDVGYLTSHPSISGASSSNNSGRTYIQDIFLDSNGHITGITTATETVVDTDTTYSAGSGLNLVGTVFSTSGVGVFDSIYLPSTSPGIVSERVYNSGGTLCFNGSPVAGSGGGTTYSAGSGLVLSGTTFHTSGTLSTLSGWNWSSGTEVPTLTGINSFSPLRVGTSANNLVQLTSDGKLPAVDGSLLTGLSSPTIVCSSASELNYNGTNSSFVDVTGMPITITSTGLWSLEYNINGYLTATGPTLTGRLAMTSVSISGVTGHPAGMYMLQGASGNGNAKITTGSPTVIDLGAKSSGERAVVLSGRLSVTVTATGVMTPQISISSTGVPSMLMLGTSYIKATKLS